SLSPQYNYHEKLLRHGTLKVGATPVKDNPLTAAWRKRRKPKKQECYYNAQLFCIDNDKAQYHEGLCWDDKLPLPLEHACVMLDGKVYDFTMEARNRFLKRKKIVAGIDGINYFGVHVPTKLVLENLVKTKVVMPLLPAYFAGGYHGLHESHRASH